MKELPIYLKDKFDEHDVTVLVNTPDVQAFRCQKVEVVSLKVVNTL